MILRSKLFRAAVAAATIALSAATHATPTGVNYSDMWTNPGEPGWGLTIDQQSDVLLGTLFIYDAGSSASWYTVQFAFNSIGPNGAVSYTGTLYRTTGPALGQPYDPNLLRYREVGTANIEFGDTTHALLTYTIDGVAVSKQIARFTFAPNSILGSYIGSTQDVTFDCTPASRNGILTTDPGPFTITQEQDSVVMRFPTCTVTGVYTQQGQVGQVDGSYKCSNGGIGGIKFVTLQSEQGGLVGTYTGKDSSCSFRGNVGGMRLLQ